MVCRKTDRSSKFESRLCNLKMKFNLSCSALPLEFEAKILVPVGSEQLRYPTE